MIDEADRRRSEVGRMPEQRKPHADTWLGKAVADSAEAPKVAGSARPAAEPDDINHPSEPDDPAEPDESPDPDDAA